MSSSLIAEQQIATPEAMHELGLKLAGMLRPGDLVILTGPLGAGKTTLTRGIGEGLGVKSTVSSPTFVLARTHTSQSGIPLVHVDAYRLGSPAEFDDLDIDFENSITVVEWGRGFADDLVESWLDVEIERAVADSADADDSRRVVLTGHGKRWMGVQL